MGRWIIIIIIFFTPIFWIIQRLGVNYSAYTSVATHQDIDQMIYLNAFVWFFYLNHLCLEVGLFITRLI